ncbi:MAG: glycogen debranching protein GlgX [Candidatus Schekmanbacteria bacterium]|nr:glycogen debranching protein GlgX [Candidatus Schekmanbacteria bacterium]
MTEIDFYPTHNFEDYKLRVGKPFPFGATLVPGGVNFSVFSRQATSCTLVLCKKNSSEILAEIPFPECFHVGNVYCMVVFDLDFEEVEYGYRMDGPFAPEKGERFNKERILLDPYAKAMGGRVAWGKTPDWSEPFQYRGRFVLEDFDWENDKALETPIEDLIVYEMHVRSFTQHKSSGVTNPGTYAGILEKIPYLKELGVNCLELMPIFEFDEFENSRQNPVTGERTYNYWGYSTVGFFAPKAGYASTGKFDMQVDELKNLVKQLHKNGIEVILDVVFNHTAEGNEQGPTFSFRGIDDKTYYMLTPEGYYYNFSGCGNTLNCNNPIVRDMVLDCLRYWAAEYHIDGFRFDLAAILGRDQSGRPLSNPPLIESLAYDPILAKCKLIAEAWDAGGLYQVGSFPAYGRWAEWNGKFRDDVRKFIKGEDGLVGAIAQRVQGSPDLYGWNQRGPTASVNFITCHDGFTLYDLVSYNHKNNLANGEGNRDGESNNNSWNCGAEGETSDPGIIRLRRQQIKNALSILLVSQGIPMILMGDEVAGTKRGNNNTYCHDNDLNWFDWTLLDKNHDVFRFFKNMLAFRHAHPVLRNCQYFECSAAYITWHGTKAWQADYSPSSKTLAFMLPGSSAKGGTAPDNTIYVAMNSYWEALAYDLPSSPANTRWHVFSNTGMQPPADICTPGSEILIDNQQQIIVGARSVIVLIAK